MAITALNVAVATPESGGTDALRSDASTDPGQMFADLFANLRALPLTQATPDQLLAEKLTTQQTIPSADTLSPENPLVENILIELGLATKSVAVAPSTPSLPAITDRENLETQIEEEDEQLTVNSTQTDPSMLASLLQPMPNTLAKTDTSSAPDLSDSELQLNLTSEKPLPAKSNELLAAGTLVTRTQPDSNEGQTEFKISDSAGQNNVASLPTPMGLGNTASNIAAQPSVSTFENTISAPLKDQTAWSKQVGERVILMNNAGQQTAELHLNPSNLGPMQVTLSFNSDQTTSAMFVAHHPETRQALQDALPQLREMFTAAGISLGQANVSAQSQQQNPQNRDPQSPNTPRNTGDTAILKDDADQLVAARAIPLNRSSGVVDLFA